MSTREYITGQDRNSNDVVAHMYEGPFENPGNPMCARGWNRAGGYGYSIFRENVGERGVCAICERRVAKGLKGVPPRPRETKWL